MIYSSSLFLFYILFPQFKCRWLLKITNDEMFVFRIRLFSMRMRLPNKVSEETLSKTGPRTVCSAHRVRVSLSASFWQTHPLDLWNGSAFRLTHDSLGQFFCSVFWLVRVEGSGRGWPVWLVWWETGCGIKCANTGCLTSSMAPFVSGICDILFFFLPSLVCVFFFQCTLNHWLFNGEWSNYKFLFILCRTLPKNACWCACVMNWPLCNLKH